MERSAKSIYQEVLDRANRAFFARDENELLSLYHVPFIEVSANGLSLFTEVDAYVNHMRSSLEVLESKGTISSDLTCIAARFIDPMTLVGHHGIQYIDGHNVRTRGYEVKWTLVSNGSAGWQIAKSESATSDKLWRKTRDHITTSGNRDIREIAKRLVEAMDEISNAADAVAWGHFAALPLTIEAKDGVQIMATIEDVRSSFEQNLATLKNAGITDVVRVVEEVHVPSPGVMIITCHDNVLRHGRHISKPWRSEITLIDVNGYWRLSRIIRAHLRHADNPVP